MKFIELFDKINKKALVLLSVLSVIFSIFGFTFNQNIIKVISVIVIGVIVSLYALYQVVKQMQIRQNAMNSVNLKRIAKKHTKVLLRFEKATRKRLKKYKLVKPHKKQSIKVDRLLKSINKGTVYKDESSINVDKLGFIPTNLVNNIKESNQNQSFLIASILSNSILEIESTLLQVEQYKTRIKFGKFIVNYSFETLSVQRGYIDLIGWSYMIMGRIKEGEAKIFKGIDIINENLLETEDYKIKLESQYNLCRSYRHLGSYKHILENKPELAIERNSLGLSEFAKINKDDYADNEEKYLSMEIGLKYGNIVAFYYYFKTKLEKFNATKVDFIKFYHNLELIDEYYVVATKFINNHRAIKLILIKAKYLELIYEYETRFEKHIDETILKDDLILEYKDNLKIAKEMFDANIFNDDSLDSYLESKIKELIYTLSSTLKGDKIK